MPSDDDRGPQDSPFLRRQRNSYDQNSRMMLIAIISLSVVIILITILLVYARCAFRRQVRRRAALRQLGITTTAHIHSSEPPKTGLDPVVIASLPIYVFKQTDGNDDETECSVCLSTFEDGERAMPLPNCKHTFHVECINKWLSSHSTCPVCRTEVEPRLFSEPREPPATGVRPTAPLPGCVIPSMEGTSDGAVQLAKGSGSISRLSSFRRMLSRERSPRIIQSRGQEDGIQDLERR